VVLDDGAVSERVSAAVLVPVFRDDHGELRLVLVVRAAGGVHGGQLGLPGGKREPGDPSLLDTALREAEEEIGLAPARVEVLAELTEVDSRATGFRVQPYLARITPPERWRLAGDEITELLTPAVKALADPVSRREEVLHEAGWPEPRRFPGIRLGPEYFLWGLTLRVLEPLVPRLLAGDWDL
jgi:8-oxo-dGTP pyrophosphatase MutT (NUDIX family)